MSGFCGWLGNVALDGSPEAVLEGMAAGLLRTDVTWSTSAVHANLAARVEATAESGAIHRDRAGIAVLHGYARWTKPPLVNMARQSGHGATLLAAYREFGPGLLEFLRGEFALAVADLEGKRGLLALDRAATRPLFYAQPAADLLLFGSTTESVRRHPAATTTICPQALFDYFHFSVIPGPRTIYREQRKLLPGQYAHFADGQVRTDFYWHSPYRETASDRSFDATLKELLPKAIGRAVEGEADRNRVGCFLSGGLDSSTVVGVLSGMQPGPVETFTIGFEADGYDEVGYAKAAAERFGTSANYHYLQPHEVVEAAPKLAAAYDEPFGNSSVIAAHQCALVAKQKGIGLLLAGDGGDEIFAGNERYVTAKIQDLYRLLPVFLRKSVLEPLLDRLPLLRRLPMVRKLPNFVAMARIGMPERWLLGTFPKVHGLDQVFSEAYLKQIDRDVPAESLREPYFRTASNSPLQRMLHLDLKTTLADNDLRKVQVACQLAGLRTRFPLLDDDLVEFAAKIPPNVLIPGFRLRDFYRKAMRGFLPDRIIDKKKHGFGLPYDSWIRSYPELRRLVCDAVATFRTRGILHTDLVDRQIAGDEVIGDTGFLWDIMMLELWLQGHGHGSYRISS